jgi:hypothetical protein
MNRRNILSLSAITALGLAMLPTGAVSQRKSLKDQIVGAWVLDSVYDQGRMAKRPKLGVPM